MTQISDIVKTRKAKFEKKSFRPWDLSGENQENVTADSINKVDPPSLSEAHLIGAHTDSDLVEIDVKNIIRWQYKDRPENELGNIEELADTFKTIGQQQPCILRVSKDFPGKYELIVGERRWRAAEIAKVKLKAIVHQQLDDKTAALIQAVENEKRSDISEFAKGMSYADKIERGIISQKDLTDILGISKQQVTRLVSYRNIPDLLFNAIDDFRKVSARTAYELSRLANKSNEALSILIELADKIREGKYGANRLNAEIEKRLSKKSSGADLSAKVVGSDGRHLFTWRKDNNASPSIHFPNDISKLIHDSSISFEDLTNDFKECLSKRLDGLKK